MSLTRIWSAGRSDCHRKRDCMGVTKANITNRQVAGLLTLIACVVSMLFFFVVRCFGLLWYQVPMTMQPMAYLPTLLINTALWTFEGYIIFRVLTDMRKVSAFGLSLLFKLIMMFFINDSTHFVFELLYMVFVPLLCNNDKETSVGHSLFLIVGMSIYQLMMMFGRGYDILSRADTIHGVIATLDYRFFLLSLLALKGVRRMNWPPDPGGHCWLFFGKFDKAAKKIGSIILKPFLKHA